MTDGSGRDTPDCQKHSESELTVQGEKLGDVSRPVRVAFACKRAAVIPLEISSEEKLQFLLNASDGAD